MEDSLPILYAITVHDYVFNRLGKVLICDQTSHGLGVGYWKGDLLPLICSESNGEGRIRIIRERRLPIRGDAHVFFSKLGGYICGQVLSYTFQTQTFRACSPQ